MEEKYEFSLPLGYEDEKGLHRNGVMRLATTKDELEIQDIEEVSMNARYRDILFLSKVIEEIDGIKPVTVDIIRNLYEADFLYLQLMYRQINGESGSVITAKCPYCKAVSNVRLQNLYKDMSIYK